MSVQSTCENVDGHFWKAILIMKWSDFLLSTAYQRRPTAQTILGFLLDYSESEIVWFYYLNMAWMHYYGLLVVELSLTTGGKQLVFCTGLSTANQQPGRGQMTNQRAYCDNWLVSPPLSLKLMLRKWKLFSLGYNYPEQGLQWDI